MIGGSSSGGGVALVVERPGVLLTVQDLGRAGRGLARLGVSPSGAMDPLAARLGNALAGNDPGAALLEVTGAGAVIALDGARGARVALAGADLDASVDGASLPPGRAAVVPPGGVIRFGSRRRGARAYLAVHGGIAVARTLGSAATDLPARIGGLDGSPLAAGARLPVGDGGAGSAGSPPAPSLATAAAGLAARWYEPPFRLRYVPGEDPRALLLDGAGYAVTPRSDRSGYRLAGPPLPSAAGDGERLSEGVPPAAIQLPPDGQPILLMSDRQTVGGYPLLGAVIRADVPRAAQLWPGDRITFAAIDGTEAAALARSQEEDLRDAFAAAGSG
jgi:biotin-dependent carboxylase-like uncharacterized protein